MSTGKIWHPQYCSCVVEVTDFVEPNLVSVIKKCDDHSGLIGNRLTDALKLESRLSQYTLDKIKKTLPDIVRKKITENGIIEDIIPEVTIDHYFTGMDSQRRVNFRILGRALSLQEKNEIQNFADTNFGISKVVITDR